MMPSVRIGSAQTRRAACLAGLLALVVLVACGVGPTPGPTVTAITLRDTPTAVTSPIPSPSASPAQVPSPGRPILYFAGETVQDVRRFVMRGVYVNGQPWVPGLPASGAAWSPAGTRLAFIDAAHPEMLHVLIRTGASPPVYGVGEGERLVPWPAWAPDGIRTAVLIRHDGDPAPPASVAVIAVVAAQLLSRHDLPAETVQLPGRRHPLNAFHWSEDGQQILIAWENSVVLDTRDGAITPITPTFAVAEWDSSGEDVLYFAVEGESLGGFYRQPLDGTPAIELSSQEQVSELGLRAIEDSYGLMHLSPDRRRLAVALGTNRPGASTVRIYDVAPCASGVTQPCPDLAAPLATYSTMGAIAALEWAPDGSTIAAIVVLPEGAALQVLDAQTGLWHSPLPDAILQPDELPVLGYIRVLSWGGG